MSKKEYINRTDTARLIADKTGFTVSDVKKVLEAEDFVYERAIEQGVGIKHHKLFKLTIETRPEKKAWDGLGKKHYISPEKKVAKFTTLSVIDNALEELNKESRD